MRPACGAHIVIRCRLSACVLMLAVVASLPVFSESTHENDLDAFMAKVLERRDENWRKLHDYILTERERVDFRAPDRPLFGTRREFLWFVKDGYLVRSPVEFDGVKINEAERRRYEARWLEEEREREKKKPPEAPREPSPTLVDPAQADAQAIVRKGAEPRFVSEAYFFKFKFEPGNYYLAGREPFEGREVLRIEYYPTNLFSDAADRETTSSGDRRREKEFMRKLNKVSLVTLWVDPQTHQILKFVFENVDLGFFPLQWLVRPSDVRAAMVMGQPFPDVWLPREISVEASFTLATGTYDLEYGRAFLDYRQAGTRARLRSWRAVDEK
jgi:hypothetical protein